MNGPDDDLVPAGQLRAMQIIVAALILGVVAFGIVAITQQANRPGPPGQPFLVYAVAVFAALAVPASPLWCPGLSRPVSAARRPPRSIGCHCTRFSSLWAWPSSTVLECSLW